MSLDDHRPSDRVRRLAQEHGVDLEALRRDDPEQYMMINAEPLLWLSPELLSVAADAIGRVLPEHRLFTAPGSSADELRLLIFPHPSEDVLRRLDAALARAVAERALAERYAYYREVRDRRGTRRELQLPQAPTADLWAETMVGPFDDEAAAQAWAELTIAGRAGMTFDVVPYGGSWFVDVFSVDEDGPLSDGTG